jgi:hypothetical protein
MDWRRWHEEYQDSDSRLSRRLGVVRAHLADVLDRCPDGEVRLLSLCAGEGRDVIPVVGAHHRGSDVRAVAVELDGELADVELSLLRGQIDGARVLAREGSRWGGEDRPVGGGLAGVDPLHPAADPAQRGAGDVAEGVPPAGDPDDPPAGDLPAEGVGDRLRGAAERREAARLEQRCQLADGQRAVLVDVPGQEVAELDGPQRAGGRLREVHAADDPRPV